MVRGVWCRGGIRKRMCERGGLLVDGASSAAGADAEAHVLAVCCERVMPSRQACWQMALQEVHTIQWRRHQREGLPVPVPVPAAAAAAAGAAA